MTAYPVRLELDSPERFTRLQLLLRVATLALLAMVGLSFGTIVGLLYVALSVFAAIRISSLGSAERYVHEDGGRVRRVLEWFASLAAWAGLVTDRVPQAKPDETVTLSVENRAPEATSGQAILRVVTGLPSAAALMVLCWLGIFVWMWAALSILFAERVGPRALRYLTGLQRWSVRLLAFQACLIDEYPPFSFEGTRRSLPEAKANA